MNPEGEFGGCPHNLPLAVAQAQVLQQFILAHASHVRSGVRAALSSDEFFKLDTRKLACLKIVDDVADASLGVRCVFCCHQLRLVC